MSMADFDQQIVIVQDQPFDGQAQPADVAQGSIDLSRNMRCAGWAAPGSPEALIAPRMPPWHDVRRGKPAP
jgi:hypothetical protein